MFVDSLYPPPFKRKSCNREVEVDRRDEGVALMLREVVTRHGVDSKRLITIEAVSIDRSAKP